MEIERIDMPPYLPSLKWVRDNGSSITMPTREYCRTLVESNSPEGMVLTVPVVGGSSSVKRLRPWQLAISSHGDWTRIHLGAIEAAYGKEPYFQHFFPEIADAIATYPPLLADLNRKLFSLLLAGMNYEDNAKDIKKFRVCHPKRFEDISSRLFSKIDMDHSIIEPLFRLGPDLIFLLNP